MVVWNNNDFSNWIDQGCPVTDELNDITILRMDIGFTSETMNKITLFKNLIELDWDWRFNEPTLLNELLKYPTEVLERPGLHVHVTWDMDVYIKWKENGSDAKLASMVTRLDLSSHIKFEVKKKFEIKLHKFVNLKNLHILRCSIATFSKEIYDLREVECLMVDNNSITEISPKINKLVNLRTSCFPVEICELRQ